MAVPSNIPIPMPMQRPQMMAQPPGGPLSGMMQRFGGLGNGIRNNADLLLLTGLGLISGQTGQQQAAMGAQGFMQGKQLKSQKADRNKTLQYLQQNDPELAAAVEAGMDPTKAFELSYTRKMEAQKGQNPFSTIGKLQADLAAGRITQAQYDQAAAGIGKPGVEVNVGGKYGAIPQGYMLKEGPDGVYMEPIAGGPAAQEIAASNAKVGEKNSNMATQSDVVTKAAQRARDAAGQRNFGEFGHSVAAVMPWTDSAEVSRQVQVLKSQATIENLNAMRRQSETGGALGNVTEGEGRMLAAKAGALDPNSPNFLRDLDDYELTLLRVIHGYDAGTRIFNQSRGGSGSGNVESADDPLGLR